MQNYVDDLSGFGIILIIAGLIFFFISWPQGSMQEEQLDKYSKMTTNWSELFRFIALTMFVFGIIYQFTR